MRVSVMHVSIMRELPILSRKIRRLQDEAQVHLDIYRRYVKDCKRYAGRAGPIAGCEYYAIPSPPP